jgi:hypothetical protein
MPTKPSGSAASGRAAQSPSDLVESAIQSLASPNELVDSVLYSGNRHESIPRALYVDRRLTPLERNAWAVVRLMMRDDGVSAFPTYEQMRRYLTTTPCATHASDETVARALTILRLTRWLSLVRRRRDSITGRFKGSLYVLHDEPLSPYEAIQLDPTYLELVSRSLNHSSKAVQDTGRHTLQEISGDPLLAGRVLPSRMQILIGRFSNQAETADQVSGSKDEADPHSGNSPAFASIDPLQQDSDCASSAQESAPPSKSEDGSRSKNGRLLIPKTDSTVRTIRTDFIDKEIRTVPLSHAHPNLNLPGQFHQLRPEQQEGALAMLGKVELELQQSVLDEWLARCNASGVRNPTAYLFGLIQRALRGNFRAWAGQQSTTRATAESAISSNVASHQTKHQIAALKQKMRIP